MARLRCKIIAKGKKGKKSATIEFRLTQRTTQQATVPVTSLGKNSRGPFVQVELLSFPSKNRIAVELPGYRVREVYRNDVTYSATEHGRAARKKEERLTKLRHDLQKTLLPPRHRRPFRRARSAA